MEKNYIAPIVLSVIVFFLLAWMALPVFADEPELDQFDYEETADGSEQPYVWVQEGDARFCYENNGGWSEEDMLVGFHTIDGEVYYFYEQEMMDALYGQMATGEVMLGAWTYWFDQFGRLYKCEKGSWE